VGGFSAFKGAPHFGQKAISSLTLVPHFGQYVMNIHHNPFHLLLFNTKYFKLVLSIIGHSFSKVFKSFHLHLSVLLFHKPLPLLLVLLFLCFSLFLPAVDQILVQSSPCALCCARALSNKSLMR